MTRYEVLHYPDDVRDGAAAGSLLGTDEVGRPYVVLDAELDVCPCCEPGPFAEEGCPSCDETGLRTTVHLTYATPEQITAAGIQ